MLEENIRFLNANLLWNPYSGVPNWDIWRNFYLSLALMNFRQKEPKNHRILYLSGRSFVLFDLIKIRDE